MVTPCCELARIETLGVAQSDPTVAERDPAFREKHDPFHIRRCDHVHIITSKKSALERCIVTNESCVSLQECTDPKFLRVIHGFIET